MGELPPIRQFGAHDPHANYILRPGGYALILEHDDAIAVISTDRGVYLPGGGRTGFESLEETVVREVIEECGLSVRVIREVGQADELVLASEDGRFYRKRCTFFVAVVTGRAPTTEVGHELRWVPPEVGMRMLTHESQRWAVSKLIERDLSE